MGDMPGPRRPPTFRVLSSTTAMQQQQHGGSSTSSSFGFLQSSSSDPEQIASTSSLGTYSGNGHAFGTEPTTTTDNRSWLQSSSSSSSSPTLGGGGGGENAIQSSGSSQSLLNIGGQWTMSKKLSSDVQPALEIQGYNGIVRKAISLAPISLNVRIPKPDEIRIQQSTTAGFSAINEEWYLDWTPREQKDLFLGRIRSRSRWITPDQIGSDDFPAQDIEDLRAALASSSSFTSSTFQQSEQSTAASSLENNGSIGGGHVADQQGEANPAACKHDLVEAFVESLSKGWRARQIWYMSSDGKFIRLVKCWKGDREAHAKLVYERKLKGTPTNRSPAIGGTSPSLGSTGRDASNQQDAAASTRMAGRRGGGEGGSPIARQSSDTLTLDDNDSDRNSLWDDFE